MRLRRFTKPDRGAVLSLVLVLLAVASRASAEETPPPSSLPAIDAAAAASPAADAPPLPAPDAPAAKEPSPSPSSPESNPPTPPSSPSPSSFPSPDPILEPELRVTAGSPAAAGRYSYICSLRSAASPFSDSFCGCAVIAPHVVISAAHCLDQDDPSLRLPRVEIGRYRRLDVPKANGDAPTEADDGIQRLRCDRTVVHPGWSFATTRNDIALCYLEGPTDWPAVGLADATAEGQRLAETAGTPLAVVGWGTERAGAAEQAQVLMRAELPVFDLQQCNATFRGTLRRGQMCAGSAAAYGEIVPDACQGDSGGPLILEGDGQPAGGNRGDVQVGIVSFGESCGILPGVYTSVAAYRRWISDVALGMAAEAGLAPEDVEQILPAALAPAEDAAARSADGGAVESGGGLAAVSADDVRARLAAAQQQRQQLQGAAAAAALSTMSVPAVSGSPSTADLANALASMVFSAGSSDACGCVSPAVLAGAGGCRPLLGADGKDFGCYVSGGAACALATEVGGGLFARGCRPTPAELWGSRARAAEGAAAAPAPPASSVRAAAAATGAAPAAAEGGGGGCASQPSTRSAAGTGTLVDLSAVDLNLPRLLAAFRQGYAEAGRRKK